MSLAEYSIGGLTLRPGRELRNGAIQVAVGSRTLALLSTLAEAGGAVLTKDDLFARVWGTSIVEENTLQAQVSQARKALGSEARRLVTVHGRGYRLDLDPPLEAKVHVDSASIAVLPFDNLTASPEHAYLADGLAEELISRLSRVAGLSVPARTSSFAYRGKAADIRVIARELGVATVLEGSVRAGGERLRVTVQLIDSPTGYHLWAESFDRTMTDLLELQDDLAEAIAAALSRELGPRIRETHSAEAMRLVLKARAASRLVTVEAMTEAASLVRQALALDPGFAKGWEALAGILYAMVTVGFAPPEALAEARAHAEKAIALDPALGGAHAILGGIEAISGNMLEAGELLEHAASIDPAEPLILDEAALAVFMPCGLLAQADRLAAKSIDLAPARSHPHLVRAIGMMIAGDHADSERSLDAALSLGQPLARPPVEVIRSRNAMAAGDFAGAARIVARLAVRDFAVPGAAETVWMVCDAFAGRGDRRAASAAAAELFEAASRAGTLWRYTGNAAFFVSWQVLLGNLDAAFAAAQGIVSEWRRSCRLHTGSMGVFWAPFMSSFRRDARFQDLVRELDLIRFWQRFGPPDGHRLEKGELLVN